VALQHIICAVDGSEPSLRAVSLAAQLASPTNAKLTLLAIGTYVVGRHSVMETWTPEEISALLERAMRTARESGMPEAEAVELRSRDAAFAIVDYAEKNSVDLIVMGSTGKDALKRFVLGSTSMDVIRKAVCPVTIVH
jgi:nucleotide-binding universal stress UspA family protein